MVANKRRRYHSIIHNDFGEGGCKYILWLRYRRTATTGSAIEFCIIKYCRPYVALEDSNKYERQIGHIVLRK